MHSDMTCVMPITIERNWFKGIKRMNYFSSFSHQMVVSGSEKINYEIFVLKMMFTYYDSDRTNMIFVFKH